MRYVGTLFMATLVSLGASERALAHEPGATSLAAPLATEASPGAKLRLAPPLELACARWVELAPPAHHDLELATEAREPLWLRRPIVLGLGARPVSGDARLPLVTGVLGELPIVAQAWAIADALVPLETSQYLKDMTLEVGGDTVRLPDALRDFDGMLARGPYSRTDDANGTATVIDVRVVLAWHPADRLHVEAGYAVAYAGGEYGAQLDGSAHAGSPSQRSEFLRHGPWAAVGLDF